MRLVFEPLYSTVLYCMSRPLGLDIHKTNYQREDRTMKRKNKILIIATAAGLLLVTMITIFAISCNLKTTETFVSIEESVSSEETTSVEESSAVESLEVEEESSIVPSSIASSSKAAVASSKATTVSSKAPEPSSAVSQTPPPVDPNWGFKEGVTYETVLKPYAEGLGYACSYSTIRSGLSYQMEFVKNGQAVSVSCSTYERRQAGGESVVPFYAICGSLAGVKSEEDTGILNAGVSVRRSIRDVATLKSLLSEWSKK